MGVEVGDGEVRGIILMFADNKLLTRPLHLNEDNLHHCLTSSDSHLPKRRDLSSKLRVQFYTRSERNEPC